MGVGVGFGRRDAMLEQDLGDTFFKRVEGLDGCAAGEVFNGGEEAVIFCDGDSDCVEIGVEDVGAVAGAVHPGLMDERDVGAAAYVFGDGGEVSSGLCAASREVGFAGVLMEEFAGFVADALDVSFGCGCQGVVPMERRQVVRGAGLICELEESLFGRGWRGLSSEGGCCEEESKQKGSCVRSILHVCVWSREVGGKLAVRMGFLSYWIRW